MVLILKNCIQYLIFDYSLTFKRIISNLIKPQKSNIFCIDKKSGVAILGLHGYLCHQIIIMKMLKLFKKFRILKLFYPPNFKV